MAETREVKKVGDVQIYLDEDGKFTCTLGTRTIRRAKLADLEREIARHSRPVHAFAFHANNGPYEEQLVDYNPKRNKFTNINGQSVGRWSDYYLYDEERVKKLEDLARRREAIIQALDRERETIMHGATRITGKNFAAIREGTYTPTKEDQYQAAYLDEDD